MLASLADDLRASFLASRAAPAPSAAPEIEIRPEPRRAARPREIAVAVAAGMIPEDLVLSYRADRLRLAA